MEPLGSLESPAREPTPVDDDVGLQARPPLLHEGREQHRHPEVAGRGGLPARRSGALRGRRSTFPSPPAATSRFRHGSARSRRSRRRRGSRRRKARPRGPGMPPFRSEGSARGAPTGVRRGETARGEGATAGASPPSSLSRMPRVPAGPSGLAAAAIGRTGGRRGGPARRTPTAGRAPPWPDTRPGPPGCGRGDAASRAGRAGPAPRRRPPGTRACPPAEGAGACDPRALPAAPSRSPLPLWRRCASRRRSTAAGAWGRSVRHGSRRGRAGRWGRARGSGDPRCGRVGRPPRTRGRRRAAGNRAERASGDPRPGRRDPGNPTRASAESPSWSPARPSPRRAASTRTGSGPRSPPATGRWGPGDRSRSSAAGPGRRSNTASTPRP